MGSEKNIVYFYIIAYGSMWGIFEATAGYLVHSISFGYGWMVFYPVACFFMTNVYRRTRRVSSIILVGLLCASIKILNLFLPCSIDKVINPAISIVFESLALAAVVFAANRLFGKKRKNPFIMVLAALTMNSGWRLLFVLYLLFLVPGWMLDVSVISATEKFIPFFITQNLITSALIFLGYKFKSYFLKPAEFVEHQILNLINTAPSRIVPVLRTGAAILMLFTSCVLELLL